MSTACPWCGACLPAVGVAACPACGRRCTQYGHVRLWQGEEAAAPPRPFWPAALRQLNPLGSRFSPLRYFADWRVNRYYLRTLTDKQLADDWGAHYLEGLHIQRGAAVLHHGCGRGRHSAVLKRLGFRVGAQDVYAHPWWSRLPQVTFQRVPASAPRLPWPDEAFGLVLDAGVIHYLSPELVCALAREVFRVLAPGGYWLLVEANEAGYGAGSIRRIVGRLHALQVIRRSVAEAGFVEHDLGFEAFHSPVLPGVVHYAITIARPGPLDMREWRSSVAARIPPHRRKLWRLRLRKPAVA